MISGPQCTIPTEWRSTTVAARNCGARCSNPRDLQVSIFSDLNPRGYGLMQRQKNFLEYEDIESSFEKRPSLWFEPIGDWGEGSVQLIEIPDQAGDPRQHRQLLAAEGSAAGQGRAYLHLSAALGSGYPQGHLAGAVLPHRRRREGRGQQDLRSRHHWRPAEVDRSSQHSGQCHGGQGRGQEYRHPAKPRNRRMAIEL